MGMVSALSLLATTVLTNTLSFQDRWDRIDQTATTVATTAERMPITTAAGGTTITRSETTTIEEGPVTTEGAVEWEARDAMHCPVRRAIASLWRTYRRIALGR